MMSHRIPADTKIWNFRVSSSDDNQKIIETWKTTVDLKSLWLEKSITPGIFIGFIEFKKEQAYEVVENMFFFMNGKKEFKPFYISSDLHEYMSKRNKHIHTRKEESLDMAEI